MGCKTSSQKFVEKIIKHSNRDIGERDIELIMINTFCTS